MKHCAHTAITLFSLPFVLATTLRAQQTTATVRSRIFRASEVQKTAHLLNGNPVPPYPFMLMQAKIEGLVRASFVVDTAGIPDTSTFRVLTSTHALFARSVKGTLPSMRFSPAADGGRKVRQLVEMPFEFKLP